MIDDTDLDELERLVREKWASEMAPKALNGEEERIAAKLLGAKQARRLANTRPGRRYTYRPEVISRIEVHFAPYGNSRYIQDDHGGWCIELVQHGARKVWRRGLDDAQCYSVISALEEKGYRVELVITEPMRAAGINTLPTPPRRPPTQPLDRRPPARPRQEPSKRHAILAELGSFRR